MDKIYHDEMVLRLDRLIQGDAIRDKILYLFGHCNAKGELADQLERLGYMGQIFKFVKYNSFAEYSLSEDTILRKRRRLGISIS